MEADGAGEDPAFELSALAHQILDVFAVADAGDVLLDDWALVQLGRDVVSCRADDLHATRLRLVVWPRADERGQERVVDVDDAGWPAGDEPGRQDLHVAG